MKVMQFLQLLVSKITVISPNGGEVWEGGSQHEIKWTSLNYHDSVRIDFIQNFW